ncbi:major tail protein [Proteinivorax tanatarense]|uniref:Major tail protein n=1 Tax=Proteinivorax tanatarense TaxID=1260629 RepID=A0AAU7VH54_9FIRM
MAQIGLKKLHFVELIEDTNEVLTYGEVQKLSGAINATINPAVNTQELYADDQLWDSVSSLGKIDVEIETADLPLKLRAKLTGSKMEDGVLVEKATDSPPYIALGFKSQKSNGEYRYVWLLKGVAQPMAEDYSTKTENIEHRTPRLTLVFMPRTFDGEWKRTADESSDEPTVGETWFDKVPGDTENNFE